MSASADHDGYLVYTQGADYVFGGTSVPTPIYAGFAALLNQRLVYQGQAAAGLGNINPTLYALSLTAPAAFDDVTAGDNIVTVTCTSRRRNCASGTVGFAAGEGYDQATGLGSIDAYLLLNSWSAAAVFSQTISLMLQTNVATLAASDTVYLTATATAGDGSTPSGTVTFSRFGAELGTAVLTGSAGSATATLALPGSQLGDGAGVITASWGGRTASTSLTVVAADSTGASGV